MKALLQNYLSGSHPSRVRELKPELVHLILALDESHPSRVRELKLRMASAGLTIVESHPSRVRELKQQRSYVEPNDANVAPLPGA